MFRHEKLFCDCSNPLHFTFVCANDQLPASPCILLILYTDIGGRGGGEIVSCVMNTTFLVLAYDTDTLLLT